MFTSRYSGIESSLFALSLFTWDFQRLFEVEAVSDEGRTRIILTQRGHSNIERAGVIYGVPFAFLSIARASVHARLITSCQEWKWQWQSSHAGGLRIYQNGHVQF